MGKKIGIYLNTSQLTKLEIISKKTGKSISELIREAIDQYIERNL